VIPRASRGCAAKRKSSPLNHPHIAAIYGLEQADATPFLVLEFIDGETLAARIMRSRLTIQEALAYARQLAKALEAAHEKGVIHHDLKPANIAISREGRLKVLDFGLAKVEALEAASRQLPTVTVDVVRAGIVVGTAAYMSPEQARGTSVDKRTDVWAFGCVLYEMLSGRRAFDGATVPDAIARILEREPDWRALPVSTPRSIHHLLRQCLRKDPEGRLRDVAVARKEIDKVQARLPRRQKAPRWTLAAAAVLMTVLILVGAVWWSRSQSAQSTTQFVRTTQPDRVVTVLIADFQNNTSDPAFDRTLEPMVRRALEDASFISAFDRTRIGGFGVQPPEKWDEAAARELAAKQGIGVVLAGSILSRGNGYEISFEAKTISGNEITTAQGQATNKDQVLDIATKLIANVRTALGDETSHSAQLLAMKSVSTASLDVVAHYAAALDAQSRQRTEEALQHYQNAVQRDPTFGRGFLGMAILSRNLGRLEDWEKYYNEALRHPHAMTARERFFSRGLYALGTNNYAQCVKEYGELAAQYPADANARNSRALCLAKLRRMGEAVDEMRQALQILSKPAHFRGNLALYSNYASHFRRAEEAAKSLEQPTDFSTVALAFAELGQWRVADAIGTYEKLRTLSPRGASLAALGLADIAMLEGRYSDSVRILLESGAKDTDPSHPRSTAATKFVAIAYAELSRGRKRAAMDAIENALANMPTVGTRFLSARALVALGDQARARSEAARLSVGVFEERPAEEPEAYAKIIEAEIAIENRDARQAVRLLMDANELLDTWVAHFDLGRAYSSGWGVRAGEFRVRPLHRASWRGARSVARRTSDVRVHRARLLLPGAGSRRTKERPRCRVLSDVSQPPRQVD